MTKLKQPTLKEKIETYELALHSIASNFIGHGGSFASIIAWSDAHRHVGLDAETREQNILAAFHKLKDELS